jgi:ectoine hydroxylase-related dioxygenase (phytanoyl-CoA dioxygenase family)
MDTQGYTVLKHFFDTQVYIKAIQPYIEKTEYIFNGQSKNDHKRRQVKLPLSLMKSLQTSLQASTLVSPNHIIKDFVLLRSLPGCQRQQAHTDYIPDDTLKHCPSDIQPLLCLFAIEENTRLVVWPSSQKVVQGLGRSMDPIEAKVLVLDAGDAVLFRADLVHAGAEYESENMRIHCYIDSPVVPRNPNKTWIVKKHSEPLVYEKIVET